jgi:hypothetical protein
MDGNVLWMFREVTQKGILSFATTQIIRFFVKWDKISLICNFYGFGTKGLID